MISTKPLLATLKAHAAQNGEAFAHLLPDRVITYRRFWARIERASARLQGEWGVEPGDTVAYAGNGHPDALILYCALQRLGALLLPLEGMAKTQAVPVLKSAGVKLVIHDDQLMIAEAGLRSHSLSSMLADWCHFNPVVAEETIEKDSLLLPQAHGSAWILQAISLQRILAMPASDHASDHATVMQEGALVGYAMFDLQTLGGVIMPALLSAQPLRFAAIEDCLQKRLVVAN